MVVGIKVVFEVEGKVWGKGIEWKKPELEMLGEKQIEKDGITNAKLFSEHGRLLLVRIT